MCKFKRKKERERERGGGGRRLCVRMHVYVWTGDHTYVCSCIICMYLREPMCAHVFVSAREWAHTCVRMSMCVCVCVCVCVRARACVRACEAESVDMRKCGCG